jgi:hypothetical protein
MVQKRTARTAQVPSVPARKKYQIRTPTESMMLEASRNVRSVMFFVVRLTNSVMAHRRSR